MSTAVVKKKSPKKTTKKTVTKKNTKTPAKKKAPPKPTLPTKKRTKVAFVIDASGSMDLHRSGVVKLFNEQLEQLKKEDPSAEVTLVFFQERNIDFKMENVGLSQVRDLTLAQYITGGSTPLYQAMIEAAQKLQSPKDKDVAYLMIVLTDGQENSSNVGPVTFSDSIKKHQATDLWTFAVMVPPGYKNSFAGISGIHDGNVTEWSHMDQAQQSVTKGTQSYYATRATGQSFTQSFFATDLSAVKAKDFNSLPTETKVKVWNVEKETDIKTFVESHKNVTFHVGAGFYQLTKPEQISQHKEVLIMKKGESVVKSDGRSLLGLPDHTVKVTPGNHADYDIFVQSTSNNRKLVRGTKLIYKV